MPSKVSNPSAGDKIIGVFTEQEGGTGKQTAMEALAALGGIASSKIGQAGGPVPLNAAGMIPANLLTSIDIINVSIEGPRYVFCGKKYYFNVTNATTDYWYNLVAEPGAQVNQTYDGVIEFIAPNTPGATGFSIDGRFIALTALEFVIEKPVILESLAVLSGATLTVTSTASEYTMYDPTQPLLTVDWEMALDREFTIIVAKSYDTANTTWVVTNPNVQSYIEVWVRVRYHTKSYESTWSNEVYAKIPAGEGSVTTPTIINPINNATGVDVNPIIECSSFAAVGDVGTHDSTYWQVATDSNFLNLIIDTNSYIDLDSKQVWDLQHTTIYYARVKHSTATFSSAWSPVVRFTTMIDNRYIETPVITSPANNATGTEQTLLVSATAYSPVNYDPQSVVYAQWQVAFDAAFADIYFSTETYSVNVAEPQSVNVTDLPYSATCYVRVRYLDDLVTSAWSNAVVFTVKPQPYIINKPSIYLGDEPNSSGDNLIFAYISNPILNYRTPTTTELNKINTQVYPARHDEYRNNPNLYLQLELGLDANRRILNFNTDSNISARDGVYFYEEWYDSTYSQYLQAGYRWLGINIGRDGSTNIDPTYAVPWPIPPGIRARYVDNFNGQVIYSEWTDITIGTAKDWIARPTITSPADNATITTTTPTITSSAFLAEGNTETHQKSAWQIASDAAFTNIIQDKTASTAVKTSWTPTALANGVYYVRVKHYGTNKVSEWSLPSKFTKA